MKRIVLTGLLLMGLGVASYAQVDDIYATGKDQHPQNTDTSNHRSDYAKNNGASGDSYAPDNYQSYNNPDDYVDYDDDSYSSRINRFDNSFYNMGYYSTFYNPFWYNPYWVDPYWGYNPWSPSFGLGISFGIGPYWNGFWGWNTWCGYPGFYSAWAYPFYAGGWYGHFYGGYWNRCYAGLEGYRGSRYAYTPRQTSIGYRMGNRTVGGNGFRMANSGNRAQQVGLRNSPLAAAAPRATERGNMQQRGYNNMGSRGQAQQGRGYNQGNRNPGQRGGGFRNVFGNGNRGGQMQNGGNRAFSGRGQMQQGSGNRGFFNGGGGGRSFNGGGAAARSFGGGGGRSSGGGGHSSGGGGRSGGGGGHSGGGRR